MPKFMVRVEIVGAKSRSDYEELHEEMATEGFTRRLTSSGGIEYKLPHAEYGITINLSGSEVRARTKDAVKRAGDVARILVVEYVTRWWSNLEEFDD